MCVIFGTCDGLVVIGFSMLLKRVESVSCIENRRWEGREKTHRFAVLFRHDGDAQSILAELRPKLRDRERGIVGKDGSRGFVHSFEAHSNASDDQKRREHLHSLSVSILQQANR